MMFESDWRSAAEFRQYFRMSRTQQWTLMKRGVLKPSVHYFRINTSRRAALRFNVPACELAMQVITQA
jgi:hypothetical protein